MSAIDTTYKTTTRNRVDTLKYYIKNHISWASIVELHMVRLEGLGIIKG